jgi:hypothetical protein
MVGNKISLRRAALYHAIRAGQDRPVRIARYREFVRAAPFPARAQR